MKNAQTMSELEIEKAVSEAWQEIVESRDELPLYMADILNHLDETHQLQVELKTKTNHEMFQIIQKVYAKLPKGQSLQYQLVNHVFNLDERTKLDLSNLRDYLTTATILYGQDVARAKIIKDTILEKQARREHKDRCDLLMQLLQAIESAMFAIRE